MREMGPVLADAAAVEVPEDDFWNQVADWRTEHERLVDDALYGDFPAGPSMLWAIRHGQGQGLIEEASLRANAWRVLQDQAAVYAIVLGALTYAQVGEALGISAQAAHKRYAALVAEAGGDG